MKNLLRSAAFFFAGVCWLAFACVLAWLALPQAFEGSLARALVFSASGNALLGLAHLTGFLAAALFSAAVGIGLCARGLMRSPAPQVMKNRS